MVKVCQSCDRPVNCVVGIKGISQLYVVSHNITPLPVTLPAWTEILEPV
jgi:hypothetical protein